MDWQLLTVTAAFVAAAGYLGRATWRTWFAAGCGAACGGCAKPAASVPEDRRRITLPQV